VGQHAGHGKKSRPNFIYDCKQFVLRFFLRICTRLILGLVEGIWGTFAESNFWIKNLNKTPLNFLKQSSQVNNFTVFFQFFIGM
jgi:hypothetical protein